MNSFFQNPLGNLQRLAGQVAGNVYRAVPPILNPLKPATTKRGSVGKFGVGYALESAVEPVVTALSGSKKTGEGVSGAVGFATMGPWFQALSLGGSSPTDPFDNWRQLGYGSRAEMEYAVKTATPEERASIARGARQARLNKQNRLAGVYIADDYGPTRPVSAGDNVHIGEYLVTRFNPAQQSRSVVPPAPQDSPVQKTAPYTQAPAPAAADRTAPRSAPVPPTVTPAPEEQNELAAEYMKQELLAKAMVPGGELQRRLWEAGGGAGMSPENFMSWVEANPAVAYREMLRREGIVARQNQA